MKPLVTLLTTLLLAAPAAHLRAGSDLSASQDPVSAPPAALFGDGTHDDTRAIQALLDTRVSNVYLPPPKRHYVLSKTLRMHSHQSLTLDRFTLIRLADKSDCAMITNDDHARGNENIAISGGVWDMNNLGQSPNPLVTGKLKGTDPYDPAVWPRLVTMFLNNIQGLTLRSLTMKAPTVNSITGGNLSDFLIEDITIDHKSGNPMNHTFDCININGNSRRGIFRNIRALSAFDDVISLMPQMWPCGHFADGPIEDILIDGVFLKKSLMGVRLYSAGEKSVLRRIRVTNVFGTCYQYAVGITNGGRGIIDGISIENIYCSKIPWEPANGKAFHTYMPMIRIQAGLRVGSVELRNLHRDEANLAIPEIEVEAGAVVDSLVIDHARLRNNTNRPLTFLVNDGEIKSLTLRDVQLKSGSGGAILVNRGTIGTYDITQVQSEGGWPNPQYLGAALPPELTGAPNQGIFDYPAPYGNYEWTDARVVPDDGSGTGMALAFAAGGTPLRAEVRRYVLEDSEALELLQNRKKTNFEMYPRIIASREVLRGSVTAALEAGETYAWRRLGEYQIDPPIERFAIAFGDPGSVTNERGAPVVFSIKDHARLNYPLRLTRGRYEVWVLLRRHKDESSNSTVRLARIVLRKMP